MSITDSQMDADFLGLFTASQMAVKSSVKSVSMENFDGMRMREIREDYGWTLADLSAEMQKRGFRIGKNGTDEISQSQLSLVESGKREPSAPLAKAIAITLGASLDYLFGIVDYDKPISGSDEVTIIVSSPAEKKLMQAIAYRLLDLRESDQELILSLVTRLSPDGKRTTRDRLRDAFSTITEIAGIDLSSLLPNSLQTDN